MSEKIEKTYTLRSVQRELEKLEKSKEKKKEKIKSLTEEIKSENIKIKELETIYDKLYHEDLQRKISDAWFKHGNITGEQIIKILELSKQIQDKIDILDVDTMANAVTVAYHEHIQKENATETAK
ncbi:MAG: hypothetical protein K2K06_06225 [Oscillospiraceae bacterium]|nr:hypothetical protein [Oscillospiraceae bacterium]